MKYLSKRGLQAFVLLSVVLFGAFFAEAQIFNYANLSSAYAGFGARTGTNDILIWAFTGGAATFTVTKTADTNDGVCDADCSLREAVTAASAGDNIVFASPLFDSPQTVNVNGQIVIDKSLTITGKGANLTNIRNIAAPNATSRVFLVTGNPVTLSKMTVSGGRVDRFDPNANCGNESCGGGIQNSGNLTLNEMFFTDNSVSNNALFGLRYGGAVSTSQDSVLTVIGSTFTNNSISGPFQNYGGAIYSAGTLVVANSTITNNSLTLTGNGSNFGGGIVREGGTATIFNTTIANNVLNGSGVNAFCEGGGVFQSGNFVGDFKALNSIVANNSINNCQMTGTDFAGTLNSLGNNLIGNTSGANITGTTTGNILNQNPQLAPLDYYGGSVLTRPIANTSVAVNAGNNCVVNSTCGAGNNPPVSLNNDQRGAARVGNVDIGAFEVNNSLNGGTYKIVLPNGRQEVAYTQTLIANVGAFTNSSISSGALPNGVTLQSSGSSIIIAGTPTQSGAFNFGVSSSDGAATFTNDYTLFLENENIPPDTTITSTPTNPSNQTNPSFTFSGTDNTTLPANMTFECSLDSAPFAACPLPQTYSNLADGQHIFAVRAKDQAGNVDPTPANYIWTVETVAPPAPIISYPSDISIIFINQPTVTGTAEPNSTVTVFINNNPVGTTSADGAGNWARTVPSPLVDGAYTVKATATDAAGNVSPERTNNFRISTTAPTLGNYPNQNINLAGNTTFVPQTAAFGAQFATATTTTDFKGELTADPITGNIRVTNAYPAGNYNVTVKVTNPFGTATRNFTLTVQNVAGCNTFDTTAFAPRVTYPSNNFPTAVKVGDFNGDGRQDLAIANQNETIVSILLRNAANNGFETPVSLIPQEQPGNLQVGDFNGDGREDIVTSNIRGHSVSVFLRNITNTGFEPAANYVLNPFTAPGRQPFDVTVGDVNGDGRQDIVTANYNGSGISVLVRNAANDGFEPFVDYPSGALGRSVEVGDFNGDGRNDIAVVNQLGTISIFLRNSANTDFEPKIDYPAGDNPADLTVGDFNGDGKQDLAFGFRVESNISVMLRNAANTDFEPRVSYPAGGTTTSLVTGDFNNDGKQDIGFNVGSTVQVLLRNAANNGFSAAVGFNAGATAWGIDIGDFNGDNRQDLVAVNLNDATVSVLQRQCPVDNAPPDTTITGTPNNPSNSSSASFTFIGIDNQTPQVSMAFECSLDSAPFSACTSPQNYTNLSDGNHSFAVRAKDQEGNIDPTPATFNWTIDATAPTLTLSSSAPNPTNAPFNVTATFSENVTGFDLPDISVTNGSASGISGSGNLYTFTVNPTAPGVVSVSVPANAAQDGAGNGNVLSNQLTRQFNNLSTLVVTKTADTDDGVCDADCSFREAIAVSNPGGTITFAPLFNSAQTITLTNGDLLIEKNLTVNGTGANLLTVSGNNASRIFRVINTTALISGLTVTGGNADNGGGIFSFGSQLTIANSVVTGNTTTGNAGGIYNIAGTLDLFNSTVSNNSATIIGGGIANGSGTSVVSVMNSTISGNSASSGGGIFTNGAVTVRSSTITSNYATNEGGGIANFTFEAVSLGNTIVAGNSAPNAPDFRDTLTSLGFNLIGNSSGTVITGDPTGNLLNRDARFLPLGNYGGTTQTHALLPNSQAINAGTSTNAPLTDQRGRARVGQVDIGAFEAPPSLIVTKTADTNDGVCDADCSLREAIAAAQANDAVQFVSPLFDTQQTISLTLGELAVNKSLTISGRGANLTTVSGNNASRVFNISGGSTNAVLEGLTITGGRVGVNNGINLGGGIFNNRALTLLNCVVSGNTVSSNNINYGGGIYNNSGTLNVINTTVSGNTSNGPSNSVNKGGAIFSTAQLNIINSTLSGNSVNGGTSNQGGAIFSDFGSSINLTNSTMTANSVSGSGNAGGGIFINFGSVNARNTIISGNSSSNQSNIFGTLATNDSNIIGDEANVNLAPLGNYGGTTQTHPLLSGSSAVNAGNNCVLTQTCATFNASVGLTADQRGAGRVGNVDIGAFEVNNSANGGNYRATLPFGRQGVNYNFVITPNNGTATYSVTGGNLPLGVNLSTNISPSAIVSLAGIPTQSGTFDFSVTTSAGGNSVVTDYRLGVIPTTSANASISGRVFTNDGNALRNAAVLVTNGNGNARTVKTGSFGIYRIDELAVGQTYLIQIVSKKFTFAPQTVFLTDNLTDLNFTAQ